MAKKKKTTKDLNSNQPSDELINHIKQLNLSSVKEYVAWCKEHHFSSALHKSQSTLYKEIEYHNSQLALKKLKKHKKENNLRHLIQEIYDKKIAFEQLDSDLLKLIYHHFKQKDYSKVLLNALLYLESESALFKDISYIEGIIALTDQSHRWIRPLQKWKPKSHNSQRQFSALARHLLAHYDVPIFMDKAWFGNNSKKQDWFIHIGNGKNIRTAQGLPVPLTKKMAHHFLTAPESYTIEAAFRWSQIHALGGDKRLSEALADTRLVRDFRDNDFWLNVIQFFIQNPMLDPVHINPIIDYIWNQKYENRIVFVERGIAEEQGPEQPNFSMNKRTPESLLNQVEKWHRKLGKETKSGHLQWTKSNIHDFEFIEGSRQNKNMKIWRIRELLNSQELVAEGRVMSHCVATYAQSCYQNRSSIWTMDLEDEVGVTKLLTIEIYPKLKQIRQIRGKRNRLPTDRELNMVNRWITKEGLRSD